MKRSLLIYCSNWICRLIYLNLTWILKCHSIDEKIHLMSLVVECRKKPLKTSNENLKTEMKATTTMEFSLFSWELKSVNWDINFFASKKLLQVYNNGVFIVSKKKYGVFRSEMKYDLIEKKLTTKIKYFFGSNHIYCGFKI
jgi:hypothetical protein